MGGRAGGFEYTTAHNGEVSITHHGHPAVTLRGNERTARNHPRNAWPRK